MQTLPPMVDMRLTPKEEAEEYGVQPANTVPPDAPVYPYGLCICFTQDELDKLGLSAGDVSVGDTIHLFAFAKVTSISTNDTEDGQRSRVEMQITNIASEDEDDEGREIEAASVPVVKRLYGG